MIDEKDKDAAASKEEPGAQKSVDDSTANVNLKPSPDDEEKQLIGSLQKDPDGIKRLLDEKRSANAEAKNYRLKMKEIEDAEAKKEEEVLKEQNKWKELADKREKEIVDLKDYTKLNAKQSALEKEALKRGIINVADVALANIDNVTIDEKTGKAEGADKEADDLVKNRPYLFKIDDPKKPQPKEKLKVDNTKPSLTPVTDGSGLFGSDRTREALNKEDEERGK